MKTLLTFKSTINQINKKTAPFLLITLTLLGSFYSSQNKSFANSLCVEPLTPEPAVVKQCFSEATSENTRYSMLEILGRKDHIEAMVRDGLTERYILLSQELEVLSENLGDASWVRDRARRIVRDLAEKNVNDITSMYSIFPTDLQKRNLLIRYLSLSSENLLRSLLLKEAFERTLTYRDLDQLEYAYSFVMDLKQLLMQNPKTPPYIIEDTLYVAQAAALQVFIDYKKYTQAQLAPWVDRLESDSVQKLMIRFSDDVITLQRTEESVLKNIMWASRILFTKMWERYNNNPFKDWYYKNVEKVLSNGLLRFRKFDWDIQLDDAQFVLNKMSASSSNDLLSRFAKSVTDPTPPPPAIAAKLVPLFDYFAEIIKERNLDPEYFPEAYRSLKLVSITREQMEGYYRINEPGYTVLMIAYVSETEMMATISTEEGVINYVFNNIRIDTNINKYVGITRAGNRVFKLELFIDGDKVEIKINELCLTAVKVSPLPDYMGKYTGVIDRRVVTGCYVGKYYPINMSPKVDIQGEVAFLNIFKDSTYITGELKTGDMYWPSFSRGIHYEDRNFAYLMTETLAPFTVNQLRGEVDQNGVFTGDLYNSRLGIIGHLKAKQTDCKCSIPNPVSQTPIQVPCPPQKVPPIKMPEIKPEKTHGQTQGKLLDISPKERPPLLKR